MYNVYIQDQDGWRLIAERVSYAQTEAYRDCCRNVLIRDVEQEAIIPGLPEVGSEADDQLCQLYGIKPGALDSAKILLACCAAVPLLIVAALICGVN